MPTLSLEPMMWPTTLFEGRQDGQWSVLHVKPRSEKAVARSCFNRHAGFFLPQYRQPRRSSGRAKDSFLPLFPGYLFLFGGERERITALETNLIVNVLSVPNQRELLEDLLRINRVIESELAISPEDRLQPGMPVAIVEGPLAGLQGTVIRRKNRMTLTLKVSFLHQGASVEIEDWMVEPLHSPLNA